MQGNLYSHKCACCTKEEKWHGNEMFPITGNYCKVGLGKIENIIKSWYLLRKQYKADKDPREYYLKILINSVYGISGSPLFKSLYNHNSASDCTLISRECLKYARKILVKNGYNVLYSDTDSVYLKDLWDDKRRLLKIKDEIVRELKKNLPFPAKTFDMDIDAEIKHIYFFKKNERYLKKHYIYVTNKDKVKVVGLPMIKNDSSRLGYQIFKQHMIEGVKTGKLRFDYNEVEQWVKQEIESNIDIITRTFRVWDTDQYKTTHNIQAQISKRYGPGVHKLIPNRYYGVGKKVHYCTIPEFKQQGLLYSAIILNKLWSELAPFLNYVPKESVCGKKKVQEELLRWVS